MVPLSYQREDPEKQSVGPGSPTVLRSSMPTSSRTHSPGKVPHGLFPAGCRLRHHTTSSPAPSGHQSVPLAALLPKVQARTRVCGFIHSFSAEQRALDGSGCGSWSDVLGLEPSSSQHPLPSPPARQHLASDCVRPTWLPGPFPLRPRPAARALRRAGGGGFHAEHRPPAHPQHRVPVSCPQGDLVMPLAKQGDSGLDGQPGVGSVSLEDSRAKGEPKDRAPGPPEEELAGRLGLVPWGTGTGSQG